MKPRAPLHERTPLWDSLPLAEACGARVLLKMEALQPIGSFKLRGLGAAASDAVERGARRLVASSGGNAGLAAAYSGRMLGVPVLVVVPRTTPEAMRARIRAEGAEVVEHGAAWDDAHARALELARDPATAYLHPFDDPRIWTGHATLVDEAREQGPKPGAVVVAVGGGGLCCGLIEGLERAGWSDVPVLAVETAGADSFARSRAAGRVVELESITSIATTLGARRVAEELLARTRRHPTESLVVSDREAVEACERFAADHRVLVEPACGAALAAIYCRLPFLEGRSPILAVVCGGAGASPELLARWKRAVGLA